MQMASVCTQLPGAFVGYGGEPECFFLFHTLAGVSRRAEKTGSPKVCIADKMVILSGDITKSRFSQTSDSSLNSRKAAKQNRSKPQTGSVIILWVQSQFAQKLPSWPRKQGK